MYEQHFGLTARPFQLTPDPAFWYETATHRKAMAYLGYGLAQGEGFVVITGDIGAGKTTLTGHLLATVDPQLVQPIRLVSTAIEPDDLLRIVATELGVDPAGQPKAALLTAIERALQAVARTGRRTLLVVDEAQALPVSSLEELRMLSNFQLGGHALLQIVLLGQPEFRDRLFGEDRLEQLRQRVIAIHHLDPMAEDEIADYLAHRLSVVGWQGRPDFAADAFAAFHRGSDGVPRRLNQLASRVMLQAALEDRALVDAALVQAVVDDLSADLPVGGDLAQPAPPVDNVIPMIAPPPAPDAAPAAPAGARAMPTFRRWMVDREETAEAEAAVPPVASDVVADAPASAATDFMTEAVAAPVAGQPEADHRLAALEKRLEEQDEALRRVLTLLVGWIDQGGAAAPAADDLREQGWVPIRGAAA